MISAWEISGDDLSRPSRCCGATFLPAETRPNLLQHESVGRDVTQRKARRHGRPLETPGAHIPADADGPAGEGATRAGRRFDLRHDRVVQLLPDPRHAGEEVRPDLGE